MSKLQVIILKGLPGSGKTTWAKDQILLNPNKYKRVNKDDLRAMVDADKYSEENEKIVLRIQDNLILDFLDEGYNVIVDNTNLSPKHEARIRCLVKDRADVLVKDDFTYVPLEECIKRDSQREKPVGEKVILGMHNQFLSKGVDIKNLDREFSNKKHEQYPKIEYDKNLPDCILCDIDGTIALMQNRSPYDLDRVDEDLVNEPIRNLVDELTFASDIFVIFVSGREDKCREKTVNWLNNVTSYDNLFMRKTGDFRKDAIVKKEIYDEHIKGKYNVLYVLDDRNQVVKMWREQGLTVLQVNDGDF
jgi:predicted kinase